jgi:hypothetical protein
MFMTLSRDIFSENSKKSVLFYCQSGRGRTTFSVVVLGLIYRVLFSKKRNMQEVAGVTPAMGRRTEAGTLLPFPPLFSPFPFSS